MLIIILLPAIFIMYIVIDSGAFKTIEPHFSGSCKTVTGVVGAEDITIDATSGLAYISSHDRRNWSSGGGIYMYQTGSYSKPILMPHDIDGTFYPHGISLWKNPNGLDRLFVVNHPPSATENKQRSDSEVIIFEIKENQLKHVKTLKTDSPFSLNDVAAANDSSFYATIDRGSLTRFGRMLEAYGRLAMGGIAYGRGDVITRISGNLVYPNGIQVSRDGKMVYVSESTGKRLLSYTRDEVSGELSLIDEISIDSGLDNIELDADGNLWIGAHPQMYKFLKHSIDQTNRSSSQVLLVNVNNGMSVDEIYLNNGSPISGSSVGAPYQEHLLIGSVYEPFILDCKDHNSGLTNSPFR
ncbi:MULTISPECIES: SMP-30/gluconolactonase/LRE family protein [Pseudoalteromonas]|nr:MULTISPECIES: SMP-30/gluconolactonase/LRE family protein [Pseudoalteromonas]